MRFVPSPLLARALRQTGARVDNCPHSGIRRGVRVNRLGLLAKCCSDDGHLLRQQRVCSTGWLTNSLGRCRFLTGGQLSLGFATRVPRGHPACRGNGKVAPNVDQKEVAPSTGLGKPGGATWPKDLVGGVLGPAEHPFREKEGADVIRVPVPVTRHTAPRRGVSSHAGCWSVGGVFVLRAGSPVRPSAEGAGMT